MGRFYRINDKLNDPNRNCLTGEHKTMKFSIAIAALLLCAGCADAISVPIIAPSGEHMIGVDCGGRSQVACYAEAGHQCPSGYDIQDSEGHFTTEAKNVVVGQVATSSVHESHYGSLIIRCHGKSKAELDADPVPQDTTCIEHSHPITLPNGAHTCEWDNVASRRTP
jgi:hypothetical protein